MPLSATARAIIVRHSQQPFHFQKNIPQKFTPGIIVIQKKNNTCHDQITIWSSLHNKNQHIFFNSDGCLLTVSLASIFCQIYEQQHEPQLLMWIAQLKNYYQKHSAPPVLPSMLSAFSKIPQQRHNCVLVVLTTFEQLLQIVQIQKNKKNIRLKYLHKRSQLSWKLRYYQNYRIQHRCWQYIRNHVHHGVIALYKAKPQEVQTTWLIKKILHSKQYQLALPKTNTQRQLIFFQIKKNHRTTYRWNNKLKLWEPNNTNKKIPLTKIHMMITPLVAYNQHHQRIGSGHGYYDRTLRYFMGKSIGLAFDCQKTNYIWSHPWDIKLQYIITAKNKLVHL